MAFMLRNALHLIELVMWQTLCSSTKGAKYNKFFVSVDFVFKDYSHLSRVKFIAAMMDHNLVLDTHSNASFMPYEFRNGFLHFTKGFILGLHPISPSPPAITGIACTGY